MTIINLQRRLRERGHIRIGQQVRSQGGGMRPTKLDTFRFTSQERLAVEQMAAVYGGEIREWHSDQSQDKWEVISNVDNIPVLLPVKMAFSQSWEQWAKGFCTHRCDGVYDVVRDCPCDCDPEAPTCKITTRLSVVPYEVPGLSSWRLDTRGYYAGTEIAAAIELIEDFVARSGSAIPARLYLRQREVRRLIDGKATVRKFGVPSLDIDMSLMQLGGNPALVEAGSSEKQELPAEIVTRDISDWKPIEADLAPAPMISVKSQLEDNDRPVARRKNAPPLIPKTGTSPRPAAAVDAGICDLCGNEYGSAPLKRNPNSAGSKYVHAACKEDAETPANGGGGGMDGTTPSPGTAEPTPTARPMTHGQHRKVMALAAEAFPAVENETGTAVDARRREAVLGMVAVLGQPGLTSRSQIDFATATPLIDALEAIKAGTLFWDGEMLVDNSSGEVVAFPVRT